MKNKSLKSNAVLNGLRNTVALLVPLINFPYVSRVLQVENIGRNNFASSFVGYFVLFASLGIPTYAIREGAKYRENKEKISDFVCQIFTINIVSTIVSSMALLLISIVVPQLWDYHLLILIYSLQLLTNFLSLEWLYSIFEDYLYITIRSTSVQLLCLIATFLFVKTPSDYHKYAFITAMGYSIANIISFFNARNLCRVSIHTHVKWKEHLKPILIIFSMTVATTIFVDSDITILGFFKGDYEVGLYSVSVKIYKIVKTLLASVLTVSVPRLSNLLGNGKKEEYTSLFIEIFKCMMTLVFPAVLGVFIMSENIVCLVAGTSYVEASGSLKILSLSLLVCMFGWMYNSCVLIPHKKEKKVLVAVVASAVLNISLNLVLIPIWGQLAAATTTFLSEGCSMILCMYYSRKLIKIKNIKKNSIQVLIGSLAVFAVCMITKCMGLNMVVETFVAIIVSVVAYAIILLCLKNEMAISVFQTVKNKVL